MGKKTIDDYKILLYTILEGIFSKKGQNVIELDIENIGTSICRSFVVCHADSSTQVKAIADSVEEKVWKELKTDYLHKEGTENLQWVLLDYNDIIVHIFQKPFRDYYNLEDLWADGIIKTYKDEGNFLNLLNKDERGKTTKTAKTTKKK